MSSTYVASVQQVTTTTLTLLNESMRGGNIDAAVLIPGLDKWTELRLLAGYASFQSPTYSDLGQDTWRFGIEARPVPAIVLGASYYENKSFVGDHWLYTIGFQLPFETADTGDGKGGFWGHIKDAFKSRRRHLSERLATPARASAYPMQIVSTPTELRHEYRYSSSFEFSEDLGFFTISDKTLRDERALGSTNLRTGAQRFSASRKYSSVSTFVDYQFIFQGGTFVAVPGDTQTFTFSEVLKTNTLAEAVSWGIVPADFMSPEGYRLTPLYGNLLNTQDWSTEPLGKPGVGGYFSGQTSAAQATLAAPPTEALGLSEILSTR